MLVLDCSSCQVEVSCTKAQKASETPCKHIEPRHCGSSMKFVSSQRSDPSSSHPGDRRPLLLIFQCACCKQKGVARAHEEAPAPRKSFADPILSRVVEDGIPDDLEPIL